MGLTLLFASGNHGFLPTRGSVMLDFVFLAMFAVTLLLIVSIALVKFARLYNWHKWTQISLAVILLVAVIAFEVDMRFFTDWRVLAEPSPYYESGGVHLALGIHLLFAIPTPFLWALIIAHGLRRFPVPPQPNAASHRHKQLGWCGTLAMLGTAVTGWVFYWLAFVA